MGTDKELEAQLDRAEARGRELAKSPTRAVRVSYNEAQHRIEVDLANGSTFAFPPELVEGLAGRSAAELADVDLVGPGIGLRWDALDVDLKVDPLLVGIFGTKAWMRELARRAGRATSEAKARAARINGQRGGRPRGRGTGERS